ncbi:hypothetical protein QCA50_014239 [Cerrena zonata]|uniref:Uncharacterized protein n=1 Tax=Cerrena zonata TaxID=2478898 RepID=A0AAW0FXD7_9APHY
MTKLPAQCGIVIEYEDQLESPLYLPLEKAQVEVVVVDVTAKVALTQTFSNDSKQSTCQTRYVFPIPARSAVCAFEMRTDDGRTIRGVAKERKQAAEEHRQAIRAGKLTSLVEWSTDDVFSISLGPIPGDQRISTTITYVLDLMDDDVKDRIRFQLPMYVGSRYGDPPSGIITAFQAEPTTRVSIRATIRTQGAITKVSSPTHAQLKLTSGQGEQDTSNEASVLYESQMFLQEDFVLLVDADGLENARGFIERHPSQKDSFAVQLTVVPRFSFPPLPSQEYIFLVDCSGSMRGDRIVTASQSLSALLKSLPRKGTLFNIFRFGTTCTSLFESSRTYDESNLRYAENYVTTMRADLGGTEILPALTQVLESRSKTIPTSVFVLTDGMSYNIDASLALVSRHATDKGRLRVFTLGIGSTASSAMCEGIARSGNGICLMAATTEDILGKCAKLVNAAKSSLIRNVTCHWGEDSGGIIQQVPHKIDTLYPGFRFIAFALIQGQHRLPKEVIVRGQRDGYGEDVEFKIPIVEVVADVGTPPLIHTLAARRLITEMEDNKGGEVLSQASKERCIIELGTKFQLASRYTSFIAVEKEKDILPPRYLPEYADDPDEDCCYDMESHWSPPAPTQHTLASQRYSGAGRGGLHMSTKSREAPGRVRPMRFLDSRRSPSPPPPTSGSVSNPSFDLIRLQSFDGSFSMDDFFIEIVGKQAAEKYQSLNISKLIWATILAIAYLRIHLTNQPELLDNLVEKATDFITETGLPADVDLGSLLTHAKEALKSNA